MRLAVVGSGYVGLVAAACFAELGYEVICVDNDEAKLEALRRGQLPIYEEYLPELLSRHHGNRLTFSSSLADAVRVSEVIFIAVGTPANEDGEADLCFVEAVSREIASVMNGPKIVVEKSTVPVYTCDWVRSVISLHAGREDFDVVSNPEFLREGTAVSDFLYPDRIVIGADSERSRAVLQALYRPLTEGAYARRPDAIPLRNDARCPPRVIMTSAKGAELIKHASNAFLAAKISFINAVANICESVGVDVEEVRQGIGADSRIGMQFLKPGIGYGGSCFPKDLAAFRAVAAEVGYDFKLLDEVARINEDQLLRFIRKIRNCLWTLRGKRVAVLGLAFKGGTDDVRESPAVAIVRLLLKEGCKVVAYDPAAMERARNIFDRGTLEFAGGAYEAADGADALIIVTDWPEFADLDLDRLRGTLRYPIIVDGRNFYDLNRMRDAGFIYASVGRPSTHTVAFSVAGQANGLKRNGGCLP